MTPRKLVAIAATAGLVFGLTGCTKDEPQSPEAIGSPHPGTSVIPTPTKEATSPAIGQATEDPSKINLALETAKTMTTWDPSKDFNRTSAELRARKFMTPERAKEVTAPERPATGAEWLNAAEKKATSQPTVKLMDDHHEEDTVAVIATWQWVTKDGESWSGEGTQTFFFTFTDEPPYKIRDYVSTTR